MAAVPIGLRELPLKAGEIARWLYVAVVTQTLPTVKLTLPAGFCLGQTMMVG